MLLRCYERTLLAGYLRSTRAFGRCPGDADSPEFLRLARLRSDAYRELLDHLWLTGDEIETRRHLAVIGPDGRPRVRRHPERTQANGRRAA